MKTRFLRDLAGVLALLSLVGCLAAPMLYFLGRLSEERYKAGFLAASVAWFVFAIARSALGQGPAAGGPTP